MSKKTKNARYRAKHKDYFHEYNRRPETMEKARKRTQKYRSENRLKTLARRVIQKAIKRGTLTRMPCVICGAQNAEAHHPDYNQRWLIVWLCKPCHAKEHYDRQDHRHLAVYAKPKSERPPQSLEET